MAVVILIPAAGAARRMRGTDKLLLPLGSTPLLAHVAHQARATGQQVCVALRSGDTARRRAIAGTGVEMLEVIDAAEGLSAALRAGARAAIAAGAEGMMVLPADLPLITEADLRVALAAFAEAPGRPLRARDPAGTPGHPVILPAALLAEVCGLRGDTGARALLLRHPPGLLDLPAGHATTDIDTPDDWRAFLARRAQVPDTPDQAASIT